MIEGQLLWIEGGGGGNNGLEVEFGVSLFFEFTGDFLKMEEIRQTK